MLRRVADYNGRLAGVVAAMPDRAFAGRIDRLDLHRIRLDRLDPAAFSDAEHALLDPDLDLHADWFKSAPGGPVARNPALMLPDLLHPTPLGHRLLGEAWATALERVAMELGVPAVATAGPGGDAATPLPGGG